MPLPHVRRNKSLAHDVIVYVERCAFPDLPGEPLDQLHDHWQSPYAMDSPIASPAIDALLSDKNEINPETVFLSLADREEVVALRILLAISGVTLGKVRSGLEDEHFAPFTAAIKSFIRSGMRIIHTQPAELLSISREIVGQQRPRELFVEGIRFCQDATQFDALSNQVAHALGGECGVRQFD